MSTVFAKIQMRRGTAASWAAANPVLAQGELAFETDTGRTKVGDGATAYLSLPSYATYDQMVAALEDIEDATAAVVAASNAAQAAETASETAQAAAETARTAAQTSASQAGASKDAAALSATAAATSASDADADRIAAQTARTASESARDASQAAQTASETARNAAQSAQTGAQTARTGAETAQTGAQAARTGAEAAQAAAAGSLASAIQQAQTAQAQASLAQGHAASAASVVQQDLSGITAQALHRSPNAITAMAIYDTSKDSDGGAWTKKCQQTSWYNEALAGKWLGAQASEATARAVSGATTSDYFQRTTDGKFYSLNAVSGITEIFRGNKRDFPKQAAIVAEARAITIYDLTEPGRPMWLRFNGGTGATVIGWASSTHNAASVAAMNARLVLGTDGSGAQVDFAKDDIRLIYGTSGYALKSRTIDARNANGSFVSSGGDCFVVAGYNVTYLAMTALPDAPIDPATGLRVPTIAVSVGNSGISVINDNGVVRSDTSLGFGRPTFDTSGNLYVSRNAFNISTKYATPSLYRNNSNFGVILATGAAPPTAGSVAANTVPAVAMGRNKIAGWSATFSGATRVGIGHFLFDTTRADRSLSSLITNTYNTGWMTGDIRRCFLSDAAVGSVNGPELVTNGDFTSAASWSLGVGWSISGGVATKTAGTADDLAQSISLTAGKTYCVTFTITRTAGFFRMRFLGGTAVQSAAFSASGTYTVFLLAVAGNINVNAYGDAAFAGTVDNISVTEAVADRTYKASGAAITGTLTKAQLATGTSLVGYSGFSASNYLREPYSADLDFGTGEWTASAWVNVSASPPRKNRFTYSEQFNQSSVWQPIAASVTANAAVAPDGTTTADLLIPDTTSAGHFVYNTSVSQTGGTFSIYAKASGYSWLLLSFTGIGSVWFDVTNGVVGTTNAGLTASISSEANGYFRCVVSFTAAYTRVNIQVDSANGAGTAWTGNGTSGILLWGAQLELGSLVTTYQPVATGSEISNFVFDRAFSSGPRIRLAMNGVGNLTAEAYDGTTTRTVTTTAAYNTDTWTKARVSYTTDGSLYISVNGREVARTAGTPLLTLNNSSAVLTIGNSYALDAPFPGSIALLKLGATVPTSEQAQFMYEQEKQLFRAGAASVLPDTGSIVDMAYDDATDRWVAVSATNESYWTGLVRNSVTASPAGSYTKVMAGSGLELVARSTTNPGVDVTIPAYGLREELVRRAEAAARLGKEQVALDYVGGFTATTTTGSAALTSVAALSYPTSYIGARISGAGIPANTTIVAVSGTTIYISAPATATATGVSITFLDFALPVGMEARAVLTAGALKQEGATKDFTRLYDGFVESIRFGAAPGVTAWVQVQAQRISQ